MSSEQAASEATTECTISERHCSASSRIMKLDVNSLRYLSKEEWRVLGSVELGQRNVSNTVALSCRTDTANTQVACCCSMKWCQKS